MHTKPILVFLSLFLAATAGQAMALTRNTYLGGNGVDVVYGIAQAPDGTIYVTGYTGSTDFPGTQTGVQPVYGGGNSDIFVAHLSADLSTLLGATYIGGTGDDTGYGIAYDAQNNVIYVVGSTTSSDFPATAGGAQPHYAGDGDTVVIRLTPDLSQMQATYLGGSSDDTPNWEKQGDGRTMTLAISPKGNIYVAGPTTSTDFPHTAGGAQPGYQGGTNDSYVAVLSPNLKQIRQATYLGGSGSDTIYGLAANYGHGIFVTGGTTSADFPTTKGARQRRLKGQADAFVTMLSPNLRGISHSTYFGILGGTEGRALYVDTNSPQIYLVGTLTARALPPPILGAQQTYGGGPSDDFAAILSPKLSRVVISSYLGGSGWDQRAVIAASPANGALYVAGTTASEDFPDTAGGVQPAYPGGSSASYLAEFTPDLTEIIQATYLGGTTNHTGIHAILVNSTGVYTAGGSGAADVPNTGGAFQPTFAGGGRDGLISIFNPSLTNP